MGEPLESSLEVELSIMVHANTFATGFYSLQSGCVVMVTAADDAEAIAHVTTTSVWLGSLA